MKKQTTINNAGNEIEFSNCDSVAIGRLRESGSTLACRYLERDQRILRREKVSQSSVTTGRKCYSN